MNDILKKVKVLKVLLYFTKLFFSNELNFTNRETIINLDISLCVYVWD